MASHRKDGSGRSAARCCELQHLNQSHGPHKVERSGLELLADVGTIGV